MDIKELIEKKALESVEMIANIADEFDGQDVNNLLKIQGKKSFKAGYDYALSQALLKVDGDLVDMPTEEVEIKELACLMCGVIDCREKGTCLRSIYFGAAKRVLQKYTKRK
jgi:hypothetical protein